MKRGYECLYGACSCVVDDVPMATFPLDGFCSLSKAAKVDTLNAECGWTLTVPEWEDGPRGGDGPDAR